MVFYWVLLGFLLDFTGFHWDELVFTGYYQVSLSFAAFVLFFGPDGTAVTGCFFFTGFLLR